jgi:tRNA (guanine-N7-)-methyltransferase
MARKKLARFDDNSTMECVFQPSLDDFMNDRFQLKGKWNEEFFRNDNPIVVELGCGKGEYTVELAKKYPHKNFVGIDIKGARIWYGAREATDSKIRNVAFVRGKIDLVDHIFGKDEIEEIWLTFSDPQPKKPSKRLSSPYFIQLYRKFLKSNGIIHLKTDNTMLFEWTLEEISKNGYSLKTKSFDVYTDLKSGFEPETAHLLRIQTHYEQLFSKRGFDIKYLSFNI